MSGVEVPPRGVAAAGAPLLLAAQPAAQQQLCCPAGARVRQAKRDASTTGAYTPLAQAAPCGWA